MRPSVWLLALSTFVAASLAGIAQGELWSGVLDSDRAIDWSDAGRGGVPERETICQTLTSSATAAQINTAISNCGSGEVVFLSAGTYNLSGGITFTNKSNVTLRGAGPTQTRLEFSGTTPCGGLFTHVCIRTSPQYDPDSSLNTVVNWTAGYSKGTTTITLSAVTGLSVGMHIVLDQTNDSNSDNGELWVCESTTCSIEGGAAGRTGRAQHQLVKVTAIDGTDVTIEPGVYMPNYETGKSPQAWWRGTQVLTHDSGVENLTLDFGSGGFRGGFAIFSCYRCYSRNVKTISGPRAHYIVYTSSHSEIRDGYMFDVQGSGSQSYGIEQKMSFDGLVENMIVHHVTAAWQNGPGAGNVYAYNYMFDSYYTNPTGWQQSTHYSHTAGINYNLYEGNDAIGVTGDDVHGTHHLVTSFRNRFVGRDYGGTETKTQQTSAVLLYRYSRFYNFIGNIVGDNAYHTIYNCNLDSCGSPNLSVFRLGISGDSVVSQTTMRWGNCDTVNDACRFEASEVPSTFSPYGNSVPGDNNLPSSFYRSSIPDWFGYQGETVSWPAIGPDVTASDFSSGDSQLGSTLYTNVSKIPARLCYEGGTYSGTYNEMTDFDADACYEVGETIEEPDLLGMFLGTVLPFAHWMPFLWFAWETRARAVRLAIVLAMRARLAYQVTGQLAYTHYMRWKYADYRWVPEKLERPRD